MNLDPPTTLPNTEVNKLLNFKSLAENTPDGFSTEPKIIRNPIPGTGNTLPNLPYPEDNMKPFPNQPNYPNFYIRLKTYINQRFDSTNDQVQDQISELEFDHEALNQTLDSNPATLEQAMFRHD